MHQDDPTSLRSLGRGLCELGLGVIDGGGDYLIVPRVYNDNDTRTAPTSVCRSDGFHRKLRTEVAKERGSENKQGNGRRGSKSTSR